MSADKVCSADFSLEVKRPECEANLSVPYSAVVVKNL